MMSRIWNVIKAIPVACYIFLMIIRNKSFTPRLRLLSAMPGNCAIMAQSFDTNTDEKSVNNKLAEEVLLAMRMENVKAIILQEEVYKALFKIAPQTDFADKLKVVEYGLRKYLNSFEVLTESCEFAKSKNCEYVIAVCHNHMLLRVWGILKRLRMNEYINYMTVLEYDSEAAQEWVRSPRAFALREALAYPFFALKGWL